MAKDRPQEDVVSRTVVIRGAPIIVGMTALLCWIGTYVSGQVLVHPLLSVLLLFGSIIFYGMSRLER